MNTGFIQGCFYLFIMNNGAMNILGHFSWDSCLKVLGIHARTESLAHRVCVSSAFLHEAKLFSIVVVPIYNPTNNTENSCSCTSSSTPSVARI